jgi:hypothetical protein
MSYNKWDPIYFDLLHKAKWINFIEPSSFNSFLKGGYYSRLIEPQLLVVVLNGQIYTVKNKIKNKNNQNDPLSQFEWFQNELAQAHSKNWKVLVINHFPSGINAYSAKRPSLMLNKYEKKYLDIIQNNGDVIVSILMGHLHIDTFKLFRNKKGD